MREPCRPRAPRHDDHQRGDGRGRCARPDRRRAARHARRLPRRRGHGAGRQLRGLAAGRGLERQVPRLGQRRHGRRGELRRHGGGGPPRLRRREHRHRARPSRNGRVRRLLGHRPPRPRGRLRPPLAAPDGHPRADRHQHVLRARAGLLLLCRLLEGRPTGPDGGPALPGGLRRDRRRQSGQRLDALLRRGAPLVRARDAARPRELLPAEQGPAAGRRGQRRLRRARRARGRRARRPAGLRLRPRHPRLPRRAGRRELPHAGSGPGSSGHLGRLAKLRRRGRLPGPRPGRRERARRRLAGVGDRRRAVHQPPLAGGRRLLQVHGVRGARLGLPRVRLRRGPGVRAREGRPGPRRRRPRSQRPAGTAAAS